MLTSTSGLLFAEIKSGGNVEGKSLKKFKEKYRDKVRLRVRFPLRKAE